MKHYKTHILNRSATTIDSYGQLRKNTFMKIAELPVAIFLRSETELNNDPLYSEVTHVGIYKGKYTDFQKRDRIDNSYEVTQIISSGHTSILYLKEI